MLLDTIHGIIQRRVHQSAGDFRRQSQFDTIHGIIQRRVLLNYRIDPEALRKILPSGFTPKLHKGKGIGGVCMIRFHALRPRGIPEWLGLDSENAAHRIAVEWEEEDGRKEGVFIPRRDTNSFFNKTFGGKVFPGIFHKSDFATNETGDAVSIEIKRSDGTREVAFQGSPAGQLPPTSSFSSVEEAAGFFSLGATGYSATDEPNRYHGMELRSLDWTIEPMKVDLAFSSVFANQELFPEGSVKLDCALVMRNIRHEWHSKPDLYFDAENSRLSVGRK